MAVEQIEGRRIRIQGTVQGVGFRPWVYRIAVASAIRGHVRNDASGVTIEAFGDAEALSRLMDALKFPPPAAQIHALRIEDLAADPPSGFAIVSSEPGSHPRVSIPPDLATCPDCVADISDRENRRYRYSFTNCTSCGPRFTIATDVPYDRRATTMASFEMCDACRREYEDVRDRRFHAQPNGCPVCGPRLRLHAADGSPMPVDDPIALAAGELKAGAIVALKGLGGFHLACDASSADAVRRLRERKRREEKPLAVMVRDLAAAQTIAMVGPVERELLTSIERPIVLLPIRTPHSVIRADVVAPGSRLIGLFLPYSPLHHLLLADVGRPLVMTSANLSEEPIAYENDEAIRRLSGIADLFLLHDRRIETRCDDSVVSVVAGHATVVRRSRGYVPRPIPLRRTMTRPVLGCGALLKNTFCLAAGAEAWLGPHIGDLENVETFESYIHAIARMERFLDVRPAVIAHDVHPDYLSSIYAHDRPEPIKVAVQHHHAHVVSAMAEHGIDGPAIGIAYDGAGLGTDGTSWGGEILVATTRTFERAATFRPITLPGGDNAVREPWRTALALVLDAFDGELPDAALVLLGGVRIDDMDAVTRLLRSDVRLPLARGVGRYFDAFGALFLKRRQSGYEGQVAIEWNQIANPDVSRVYAYDFDREQACPEIDLRPTLRVALREWASGVSVSAIAAAFHNTLAEATAAAVRFAIERYGRLPIVASGGCFQNARLAESVRAALAPEFGVVLHEQVPPGDGGIALG